MSSFIVADLYFIPSSFSSDAIDIVADGVITEATCIVPTLTKPNHPIIAIGLSLKNLKYKVFCLSSYL